MMDERKQKLRERIVKDIFLKDIYERASGKKFEKVYDEKPNKKFFIGNLSPQRDIGVLSKVITKVAPSNLGLEVLIKKQDIEKAKISITPRGAFYYRVFPTLKEQLEFYKSVKEQKFLPPLGTEDEKFRGETRERTASKHRLREVYKKIKFKEIEIVRDIPSLLTTRYTGEGDFDEVKQITEEALRKIKSDSHRFFTKTHRTKIGKEVEMKIQENVLESEEDFENWLRNFGVKEVVPSWDIGLRYKIADFGEKIKLTVILQNNVKERWEQKSVENSVFESKIELKINGAEFAPYVLDYLKDDYKYDGNIDANGINCAIYKISEKEIHTKHMPVFTQKRNMSKSAEELKFQTLTEKPIETLKKIEKDMEQYLSKLEEEVRSFDKSQKWKDTFKEDIKNFGKELERYKEGIRVLEEDEQALESFKLMNDTFKNCKVKNFVSWYLFQIVFAVMFIPDAVAVYNPKVKNYRDKVDVIYFPTGGGKTEAYLAAVIFTAFFDRLMGKKAGVSAVTKFPLRLLSLQQLQRIADIFAQAELLRRKHPIIGKDDCDCFSTGYYVGADNTPNRLYKEKTDWQDREDYITPILESESEKKRHKIISKCPFCGKDSVEVEGDLDKKRIYLVCKNPDCSESILPIYISDEEIYRYLPTFIVSTIDKTATAAFQRFFRHIFGQVTHKCPDHGYLSGNECFQKSSCTRSTEEFIPVDLKNPTPSILIQDEMHLIKESLGSYNAHYESFLDHYIQALTNGKRMKIIAATATISRYWQQLNELYMREGYQFPSSGPKLTESFYAYEGEEINRLFVGVMPHNKTIIFTVLDLIRFYSEIIQKYKKNPELLLKEDIGFRDKNEVLEILKDYELMLCYNLVKLEGDAINQSINTMVNPRLKREQFDEINIQSLTGDVTFGDVIETLSIILNSETKKKIDLITATSMISHGVDIDVMNFMVFRGMPRNNAEYIQASSRIGRKYPALSFIVFNHTRERDQSYYLYFAKFHEFKDMLVEPVPINRWAKFSIHRTLPGIFCASILNYFEPKVQKKGHKRLYMTHDFEKVYSAKIITDEEILDFIQKSYKTQDTALSHYFKIFIERKTKIYISQILDKSGKKEYLPFAISDRPMTSLRDTDIPVEISPTPQSFHLMESISVKGRG